MTKPIERAHRTASDAQHIVAAMLREITKLCVLGRVPREVAIDLFREELDRASESIEAPQYEDVDAFDAGHTLGEWHNNTRFLDRSGKPAPLAIAIGEFDELCRVASRNAEPSRVLNFMTRAGAASVHDGVATATRRGIILASGDPGAVARAIELATAFSNTLVRNLTREINQPSYFERTVVNTVLAKRHVPALLAYLSVHGQSFLEDLDSWMSSRESHLEASRVGVGLYFFGDHSYR